MAVFVDTSAIYALLNRSDPAHEAAKSAWAEILQAGEPVLTSNYVLVETFALVQRRLGMAALRDFRERLVPILRVQWIDPTVHDAGVSAVLSANRRDLTLVDCTSFHIMRQLGLKRALAVDEHFAEHEFEVLPT